MNTHHKEILEIIRFNSGQGTQHTFLDGYLGNSHPRYAIDAPTLRMISKEWMKAHRELPSKAFCDTLTGLIKGESSTEKVTVGMLLDLATPAQKKFNPIVFDKWLDHLIGWAEIDSVCTGRYTITEIPANFAAWKKILTALSKSKNINKRRASIVFLCSPLAQNTDPRLAPLAFKNIERLKKEKEILITKAISWVLRSMVRHHRAALTAYLNDNQGSLPSIAVRETNIKLLTGKKTSRKNE